MTEGIDPRVGETARDEIECEEEVGEREVREEQLNELVDRLYTKKKFARDGMVCLPDLTALDEGVDGGEESTIEPSSTLRDKLRSGICSGQSARHHLQEREKELTWHICFTLAALDVF